MALQDHFLSSKESMNEAAGIVYHGIFFSLQQQSQVMLNHIKFSSERFINRFVINHMCIIKIKPDQDLISLYKK